MPSFIPASRCRALLPASVLEEQNSEEKFADFMSEFKHRRNFRTEGNQRDIVPFMNYTKATWHMLLRAEAHPESFVIADKMEMSRFGTTVVILFRSSDLRDGKLHASKLDNAALSKAKEWLQKEVELDAIQTFKQAKLAMPEELFFDLIHKLLVCSTTATNSLAQTDFETLLKENEQNTSVVSVVESIGFSSIPSAAGCVECDMVFFKLVAASALLGRYRQIGGFIELTNPPQMQRQELERMELPEFRSTMNHMCMVPHLPAKFLSCQIHGKDEDRMCLPEAITTAAGHTLQELGISIASLDFAAKSLDDSSNWVDSGFSVSVLNRAFEETTKLGHAFRLEHVHVEWAKWLPLFVPFPMMVVSLHQVVTSNRPLYHWIVIDVGRLVIQIAPSSRSVDDTVAGVVRVELEDLTDEEKFAKHMAERYHLGPPVRAYKMMVHVSRLHDTCFVRPDLYSNHRGVKLLQMPKEQREAMKKIQKREKRFRHRQHQKQRKQQKSDQQKSD